MFELQLVTHLVYEVDVLEQTLEVLESEQPAVVAVRLLWYLHACIRSGLESTEAATSDFGTCKRTQSHQIRFKSSTPHPSLHYVSSERPLKVSSVRSD